MKRLRKMARSIKDNEQKGAQEAMMEEIFHDMYHERGRIYKVNFFRGIFFGIGSAIGGTIAIAIILWILSLFVNFPVIGDFFKDAQNNIEQSQQQ